MPFGFEGLLGGAYMTVGQPEKYVEMVPCVPARGRDTHGITRAGLVFALMWTGSGDEAMAAADGLIEAAEATRNPWVLSFALLAYGFAFGDTDPVRAMEALRRGLVITQESGNRFNETHLAIALARMEVNYGDPLAALDYITFAIRNYYDAGNIASSMRPCHPRSVLRPARTLRVRRRRHRFRRQPHDRLLPNSITTISPSTGSISVPKPTNRSRVRCDDDDPRRW